jgi:hypothetical protein
MKSSYNNLARWQTVWFILTCITLALEFQLVIDGQTDMSTEQLILLAVFVGAFITGIIYLLTQIRHMNTKPICSSATIEGLERLINEYFYSTSYKIDPTTLQVSSKAGKLDSYIVVYDRGRYKFRRAK